MSEEFLTLCLDQRKADAEAICGFHVHPEWYSRTDFIRMRRDQYRSDPKFQNWGVRAMVLHSSHQMIGFIGFHESPDPPHLHAYASNAVEFGYTVFPEYRQSGFATEAVRGLMRWCIDQGKVENFIVSISPGNAASQAIARHFGFVKVGEHMDEQDGLEEVLRLPAAQFIRSSA